MPSQTVEWPVSAQLQLPGMVGKDLVTRERLSVPGPGRTVSAEVEERAAHVRKAVHFLEPEFRSRRAEEDFSWIFAPRWEGGHASPADEPLSLRAAWSLVNVWLLGRLTKAIELSANFLDGEAWFAGNHRLELPSLARHIQADAAGRALRSLSRLSFDADLLELLPYVLELHGPGSRLSVMRDPTTRTAREAKRKSGIFYTPADVAEYMATGVLAGRESPGHLRFLDPSCGTGVYFVALLKTVSQHRQNGKPFDRLAFATCSFYGFDISTLAVESSAFVLLHHCLADAKRRSVSPWAAWHALRLNLAATDALKLQAGTTRGAYTEAAAHRQALRDRLLDSSGGEVRPSIEHLPAGGQQPTLFGLLSAEPGFPCLGAIFPEAEEGFDVMIGNPPYADLGQRDDLHIIEREYSSLREGQPTSANLFPLFIEMMWRVTRPGHNTSAVVVPLSIAYHQGPQYKACRHAMASHGGRWRCAFFDREPHALFGEDVKTRNAILFRSELPADPPRQSTSLFETGPLRKWTSRTRDQLFSSITFTPLQRVNLDEGLPKLCGPEQATAYSALVARLDSLRTICDRCRTCQPREATLTADCPRVFVASTAYNFLNVFRSITQDPESRHPLSENTVHCLEFTKEETAEIAFAILSSRLTFWLWHVQCDGFHVGAWFIQNLPFGRASFNSEQTDSLQKVGRSLWRELQRHRIVSLNRGKQTIAYRSLACEKERDAIDDILLDAAKLPKRFKSTLREYVKTVVVVDENDHRRNHLRSLFDKLENSS
jgi:hypothetical protein